MTKTGPDVAGTQGSLLFRKSLHMQNVSFELKITLSLLLFTSAGGRHKVYDGRQQACQIFVLVGNIISHSFIFIQKF